MTDPITLQIICPICHEPVKLETSKTDECGRAIHEECCVQILTRKPPSGYGPESATRR